MAAWSIGSGRFSECVLAQRRCAHRVPGMHTSMHGVTSRAVPLRLRVASSRAETALIGQNIESFRQSRARHAGHMLACRMRFAFTLEGSISNRP
ncbi:hypothetical protein KTD30_06005 [Burkholderia multivorans]|uniref:hypothetical protein n=1 Tax=Burkholderia multivorans TaxID=87883 RepID=UPI0011B23A62|nr:hypothetical protein [Burkholderia multivorans]MBU9296712.1 hypothetical protein [Burkholderia multivorans]